MAELHRQFEAGIEAIEGLPWPLLKQGRELTYSILLQSWVDAEQFDCTEERANLLAELAAWLSAVRRTE